MTLVSSPILALWALRSTIARAVLLLCLPLVLLAQPREQPRVLTPDDRVYLERVSLGDARATLYEHVRKLPLSSGLTVGAWAGQSVQRDRELRLWLRTRLPPNATRIYSDGSAETDLRLEPRDLADFLRGLARGDGKSDDLQLIDAAAGRWQPAWVTGAALLSERGGPAKPAGWEDISFEGLQATRNAARADALRELLAVAGRLKVTNARTLQEFLNTSVSIDAAVTAALEREAKVEFDLGADQVALATATIHTTRLLRLLTPVFQEHGAAAGFSAEDFREMAVITPELDLRASGMAAPPPKYRLLAEYRLIELDVPPWLNDTLRAEGRYAPEDEGALAEEARPEAARLSAMDQLRRQVEELPLVGGLRVGELLAARSDLKDDVIVFLSGARLSGAPQRQADGTLVVQVELPLRRLWHIMRRGIRVIELDPDQALPAASQPAGVGRSTASQPAAGAAERKEQSP